MVNMVDPIWAITDKFSQHFKSSCKNGQFLPNATRKKGNARNINWQINFFNQI